MKKIYNTPEMETIRFTLSHDILGDSKHEDEDNPIYGGGSSSGSSDPFDPFS